MGFECFRRVCCQKHKQRLVNTHTLNLVHSSYVLLYLLNYFNSISSWHLEIQKHQANRSDFYRIYILFNLFIDQLTCLINCFLSISTKFTPIRLVQVSHLGLQDLQVYHLIFCDNNSWSWFLYLRDYWLLRVLLYFNIISQIFIYFIWTILPIWSNARQRRRQIVFFCHFVNYI